MIMVLITIKSQGDSDKKKVIESNWLFFKVNRKANSDVAFSREALRNPTVTGVLKSELFEISIDCREGLCAMLDFS
ncbi:hypothetical protein D5074_03690 [Pectobacterium polaris]|nr:hypothetical protein D5074_03690 [Pectobacterium polaris]